MTAKHFTESDQQVLEQIIAHRRDVRGNRFAHDAVPDEIIERIVWAGVNAPSVGFSQPWELVVVRDIEMKNRVKETFQEENTKATEVFEGEKGDLYRRLKLEGIIEAPVNIAVFYKPSVMPVLGQTSMGDAGLYSVVCAVQNMWLMARALNVGMGWVSILDPDKVSAILNAPAENRLVAYLCVGYVKQFETQPELETLGWERRRRMESIVLYDCYS